MTQQQLWTSHLSCGCWTRPVSADGHPYGRAREGSYVTCVDDLRHQGSYRVLETTGLSGDLDAMCSNGPHLRGSAPGVCDGCLRPGAGNNYSVNLTEGSDDRQSDRS